MNKTKLTKQQFEQAMVDASTMGEHGSKEQAQCVIARENRHWIATETEREAEAIAITVRRNNGRKYNADKDKPMKSKYLTYLIVAASKHDHVKTAIKYADLAKKERGMAFRRIMTVLKKAVNEGDTPPALADLRQAANPVESAKQKTARLAREKLAKRSALVRLKDEVKVLSPALQASVALSALGFLVKLAPTDDAKNGLSKAIDTVKGVDWKKIAS